MKTHIKKKTLAFDFTKATLYIGFHTSRNKTLAFDLKYNGFRISRKHHNENHSSSFTISNHSHNKRNLTCTNFKTNYSRLTRTNKKIPK